MIGLLLVGALAAAAPQPGPLRTEEVTILFYGEPPPGYCGVVHFGQALRVRKADGVMMMDLVLSCPLERSDDGGSLPAEGSICKVSYRTRNSGDVVVKLIADRTDRDAPIALIESLDCHPPA